MVLVAEAESAGGEPVLIEMANDAGRTAYVRRCPVQDVEVGGMIYLENDMGRRILYNRYDRLLGVYRSVG
ncbi:hypothetical protein PMm318_A42990 [Pseudomonas moorei]